MNKIRNTTGDITTSITDVQRITRENSKRSCASELDNLEEMNRHLKANKWPTEPWRSRRSEQIHHSQGDGIRNQKAANREKPRTRWLHWSILPNIQRISTKPPHALPVWARPRGDSHGACMENATDSLSPGHTWRGVRPCRVEPPEQFATLGGERPEVGGAFGWNPEIQIHPFDDFEVVCKMLERFGRILGWLRLTRSQPYPWTCHFCKSINSFAGSRRV